MNTEHKISLFRYIATNLESKETDERINTTYGLCFTLDDIRCKWQAENDMWSSDMYNTVRDIKRAAFRSWPRYSGNKTYPIPHPWTATQRAEWEEKHGKLDCLSTDFLNWHEAAYDTVNETGGNPSELDQDAPMDAEAMEQYLKWRFELRDHLVQYFRNMADQLANELSPDAKDS